MRGANQTGTAIGLMLGAVLIFTVMDTLAKWMTQHYSPLQVVWSRYTGQTVIVLLLVLPRLFPLMRTRNLGAHMVRSVFQFGATACFFAALGQIGLAEATAIADLNPVLITLGAALFLGERLGPRRLAGVFVSLVGAMIIIRPGLGVFTWAALLPLGTAVCYSGYALVTRKLGATEPVWTSLIYTALVGTAITSAIVPFHWQPVAMGHWLPFAAVGLLGAAAQLCMIRAFSLAEASAIAPFSYTGLLFATLWGFLFFGEVPDAMTGLGALVIVLAGLYVWHRETRAARVAEGDAGQSEA